MMLEAYDWLVRRLTWGVRTTYVTFDEDEPGDMFAPTLAIHAIISVRVSKLIPRRVRLVLAGERVVAQLEGDWPGIPYWHVTAVVTTAMSDVVTIGAMECVNDSSVRCTHA